VLASLRRLITSFVGVVHTRAELIAREFERERIRVTRLLLVSVLALFFFALGAMTFTVFIIVLFWDSQRLAAIGFLTVLYFAVGIGLAVFVKRDAARGARPFAVTLAQLKKDREELLSRR
jgi:uncharacterized membrane protein YqjE